MAQLVINYTVSQLRALFAQEAEDFMLLDDQIEKQAQKVLTADSKQDALEEALSLEYLIVRLRTRINSALSRVNTLIDNDTNIQTKTVCKQHQSDLLSRSSRLTDLREDLNSLQKLAYTARNIF